MVVHQQLADELRAMIYAIDGTKPNGWGGSRPLWPEEKESEIDLDLLWRIESALRQDGSA